MVNKLRGSLHRAYMLPVAFIVVLASVLAGALSNLAHAAAPACNSTSVFCSVNPAAAGINAFGHLANTWGAILSSTGTQVVLVLAVVVGIGWVMRTFRRSGGR